MQHFPDMSIGSCSAPCRKLTLSGVCAFALDQPMQHSQRCIFLLGNVVGLYAGLKSLLSQALCCQNLLHAYIPSCKSNQLS